MVPSSQSRSPEMAVCRNDEIVSARLRGGAIAIGNFDGVHLGHQELIRAAQHEAAKDGALSAVLTFEPHPRAYFDPGTPHFRLTPEAAKLKVLSRLGVGVTFLRRFDAGLAGTSAEGFVTGLLGSELGASTVIVGYDFHFGRGRAGTPALLTQLGRQSGLRVRLVEAVSVDGEPVSSSLIRAALEVGNVGRANTFLGYRWFVSGEIVHGEKRGRALGMPTANMVLDPGCKLAHGIYAVRVATGPGEVHDGVASFGRRPTFDNGAPLLETHLFDYSGDLYGAFLEIEFIGWIRGEERFGSLVELMDRMSRDAAEARLLLDQASRSESRSMIG